MSRVRADTLGLFFSAPTACASSRAVAVGGRQRHALQGRELLFETLAQEAVVGARPGIDHLVLVAGAAEKRVAAPYQHGQEAERRFIQVVQFIGDDDLVGRQLLAQRLVVAQHAHQVVGGVERRAELDLAGIGAAQAFVFAQPQIMRARHAQHLQIVFQRIAVEVGRLEIQPGLGAQLQFQELGNRRIGGVDFQRIAVGVFLGHHLQRFPGHRPQLFVAAQEGHLHALELAQHLGGKGVKGIDAQALDHAQRHADFQQALAQGHPRRFRKDQRQHALGRTAPVQRFGQAQRQGGGFRGARVGVDQHDFFLRRLDRQLLWRWA